MMRPTDIASHACRLAIAALLLLAAASCSTTRRIPADETLYTGVKRITYATAPGEQVPEGLKTEIAEAVDVHPNNYINLIGMRSPFPIGLWVYNNMNPDAKGLKGWLYRKLVEEPVLVSDVRPQLRTHLIEQALRDAGFFRGTATYEEIPGKRNKHKASIAYNIDPGPAYLIDSISFLPDTCDLTHRIDSVARKLPYFTPGQRFSTDSLSTARTVITNSLRNRGYYFFRPEFIEYLADSTITPERIALRLDMADNAPPFATRSYTTGKIFVTVNRNLGGGRPDTIVTDRATIIKMSPSKLRTKIIPECVTFRRGRVFSVRDMNRTQNYFSRLGIFRDINIAAMPDTTALKPTLDVFVDCTLDAPYEASIEANVSSKSNSYLGPGLTLALTNRNMFGGGEQFRISLTGSYEWQTGRNRSSVFNSYEVGINTSLAFPRLLAPNFVRLGRRNLNWTRFNLGFDLLNRPHYFRMAQTSASMSYDWQYRRHFTYTFTPLKLTYIKLQRTTALFDSIIDANPAVGQSFRDQFIPQMSWSIVYDRAIDYYNTINVQATLAEAGNICWALWRLAGVKGEKRLFRTPFSQFIKATGQVVYSRRIGEGDSWLVSRLFAGAAYAYGNSREVPYSEQFYVGGANSVRAFAVRSIGPGSYHVRGAGANNFDQTGTLKFEFNLEYRFPLFGMLHGAVFFDSGNVWLMHPDPSRPGGTIEARTFFRDLATGTGVGLRFDMSMLVIRGDLGIGIHAPYDTGRSGYYNMTSFKNSLAFHLAIGYPF